jgi:hypothetical protein
MSYLANGGMNELGQRVGDQIKYLLESRGIEYDDFKIQLTELLTKACAEYPPYEKLKSSRKRPRHS